MRSHIWSPGSCCKPEWFACRETGGWPLQREAPGCSNDQACSVRLKLRDGRPEYIGDLQKMRLDGIKCDGVRRYDHKGDGIVWRRGQVLVAAEAGAFAGLLFGVAGIVARRRDDLQGQKQQRQSGQAGEKTGDVRA